MTDFALNPAASISLQQARPRFVPKPDGMLTVTFGHESARVKVTRVLDDDTALVEFLVPPMVNRNGFKVGDVVGCRRRDNGVREFWEAQNEAAFMAEQKKITAERQRVERERLARQKAATPPAKEAPAKALAPKPKRGAKPKAKAPAKRKRGKAA